MRTAVLFLLLALFGAHPTRAQVAVAVSIPDANAVHREFAAGLVAEAKDRFDLMTPPLPPTQVAECGTDEACITKSAERVGASHLLVVGIAAIGAAEFVVSVRLLDVKSGDVLTNVSDVATPGRDPRDEGVLLAQRAFDGVTGVPAAKPAPPAAPPPEPEGPIDPSYGGLSWVSITGWSVVGVTVAGGVAGLLAGLAVQSDPSLVGGTPFEEEPRLLTGAVAAATGVGLAAGLGLVVVDQAWLAQPDALAEP